MNTLLLLIYNLAILSGTVFLIVEYDWSAWWMLFAVILLGMIRSKEVQ
jgi:hypothetical protein